MSLTSARLIVLGFWISLVFIVPICYHFKNFYKQSMAETQCMGCSMIFFLLIQCAFTYVWAMVLDQVQWEEGFWHNTYLFFFGHGFWEFVLGAMVFWPITLFVFCLPFSIMGYYIMKNEWKELGIDTKE